MTTLERVARATSYIRLVKDDLEQAAKESQSGIAILILQKAIRELYLMETRLNNFEIEAQK